MSQFYEWLRSKCCDAKIHTGMFNEDRRDECSGCNNKIVDMDKDSYDIREKDND